MFSFLLLAPSGAYGSVAQSVERKPEELGVVGPTPTRPTSDECEHRDSCYNRYGRSRKVPVICPVGVEVAYRSPPEMRLQVSRRSLEGSTQVASTLVRGVREPPDVVDGSFVPTWSM